MVSISLYNNQGQAETLNLDLQVTQKEQSPITFARAIRALFQNWRQGTVACKTRGQLAFSNKKPWRQKGTGRARVSSIRSPLWRKGGVIFGPQPRTRTLAMNAQQRKVVFNNLLFNVLDNKALQCVDFASLNKPSTKTAVKALKAMGLEAKKVVLFLPFDDQMAYASFRNLPNVSIVFFDEPNAYHLSNSDCWLFLKKDVELLKTMVAQWN
ncbi:50S ribosomal protein L4 [bacterium]|nr:50S ribosomal protein L4 [bacterium]